MNTPQAIPQKHYINQLRATAIILVVVYHALRYGHSYFPSTVGYQLALSILNGTHVPLFFMIAGYLCHKQPVLAFYKKKFLQIGIPFFLFTTAKLVFNLVTDEFSHTDSFGTELVAAYVVGEYYWFCYAILWMFALAPLLWRLPRKWLPPILAGFLILNILNNRFGFYSGEGVFQIFNYLNYCPWFLLGQILSRFDLIRDRNRIRLTLPSGLLAAAGIAGCVWLNQNGRINGYLYKFLISLTVSYLLLLFFRGIGKKIRLLDLISRYSFQLFLLDSFLKVALFFVLSKFIPITLPITLVIAVINIALGLCICAVASRIKWIRSLLGIKHES